MKFSVRMCFKVILKVTKNHGFTLSLKDTFFEKPQGGQIDPPAILGLTLKCENVVEMLFKLQQTQSHVAVYCLMRASGPTRFTNVSSLLII